MQAVFLQHEGFLGAVGALTSYEKLESNNFTSSEESVEQVRQSLPSEKEKKRREKKRKDEIFHLKLKEIIYFIQVISQEPSVPVDGKVTAENGDHNIFPYLLVNIGSGVSMIEVCFLFFYFFRFSVT